MIDANQLTDLIIKPALLDLVMYSEDVVELLLFTCAVESNGGTYLKQLKGKALGIYQMEPETYNDIWQNYLKEKQTILLSLALNFEVGRMPSEDRLIYDLRFATAMTRIHYKRFAQSLPSKDDIPAMWFYYKKYYNTCQGSASEQQSVQKYLSFVKR